MKITRITHCLDGKILVFPIVLMVNPDFPIVLMVKSWLFHSFPIVFPIVSHSFPCFSDFYGLPRPSLRNATARAQSGPQAAPRGLAVGWVTRADLRWLRWWQPAGNPKWMSTHSHDGSMVLLYMVCHGSHQYTPFMLALIYQHHGSYGIGYKMENPGGWWL